MINTPSTFEHSVLGILRRDVVATEPVTMHPDLDTLLDYQIGSLPSFEQAIVDGHLLRCHLRSARVGVQPVPRLDMDLPVTLDYLTADFSRDAKDDLEKAEK